MAEESPEYPKIITSFDSKLEKLKDSRVASQAALRVPVIVWDVDGTLLYDMNDSKTAAHIAEKASAGWLHTLAEKVSHYLMPHLYIFLIAVQLSWGWRPIFFSTAEKSSNEERLVPFIGKIKEVASDLGAKLTDSYALEVLSEPECTVVEPVQGYKITYKSLKRVAKSVKDALLIDDSCRPMEDEKGSLFQALSLYKEDSTFSINELNYSKHLLGRDFPNAATLLPVFLMGIFYQIKLWMDADRDLCLSDAYAKIKVKKFYPSTLLSSEWKQIMLIGLYYWTQLFPNPKAIQPFLSWVPESLWVKQEVSVQLWARKICTEKCVKSLATTMEDWTELHKSQKWTWKQIMTEDCQGCHPLACHLHRWASEYTKSKQF